MSDPSSCAKPEIHRIKSAVFNLCVQLDDQCLEGWVEYTVTCPKEKCDIHLDMDKLEIEKCLLNEEIVQHKIVPQATEKLGSELIFPCFDASETAKIRIHYTTSPTCSAIQWLHPMATKDKRAPFFFTQCQSIHARSLYPCQDTPLVKFTWKATMHTPCTIDVVMAGTRGIDYEMSVEYPGMGEIVYEQKVPIPSYLFAIAGGRVERKEIGPRSTVWAEPSLLEDAANEFSDCEKMLKAAEELCGNYEWGNYDILVLPPSFPYGGMENPCLTFVTPTLIAKDKSLVNVVAHEIAHSWTGNLVTNCNWEHFWLNEGHTVYVERLIMEKLCNAEMRELMMNIGYEELRESVTAFGADNQLTRLIPNLVCVHPDDAYSRVPYEKGSLLLYYLETIYGKEAMLKWLKAYVQKFRFKSIDSTEWKNFIVETFGEDVKEKVNFDDWFNKPGMPDWKPGFASQLVRDCEEAAELVSKSDFHNVNKDQARFQDLMSNFHTKQKEYFFRILWRADEPVDQMNIARMNQFFKFSDSNNARVRLGWSMVIIRAKHSSYIESVFEFLNSNGVMKFVRPIYKELVKWDHMKQRTLDNFKEQMLTMHPTTAQMIGKDIGIADLK